MLFTRGHLMWILPSQLSSGSLAMVETISDLDAASQCASSLLVMGTPLEREYKELTPMVERAQQWPTPMAGGGAKEGINISGSSDFTRKIDVIEGFRETVNGPRAPQSGKLNPRWVETLMGLPVGWVMPSCSSPLTIEPTNSGRSETELSRPPQSERSEN